MQSEETFGLLSDFDNYNYMRHSTI